MRRSTVNLLALLMAGGASVAMAGTVSAQGATERQSENMGTASAGAAGESDHDSAGRATRNREFTGQPPGIGEKGSGQTQSTLERSGGPQKGESQTRSQAASELKEGKTAKAMEEQTKQSR